MQGVGLQAGGHFRLHGGLTKWNRRKRRRACRARLCKSAPFSRAVKPAAQENAVQEAAAPLGAPCQYRGLRRRPDRKDARLHRSGRGVCLWFPGRGLAVLGASALERLAVVRQCGHGHRSVHGTFCGRGTGLCVSCKAAPAPGKLVLAGGTALPGAWLCTALRRRTVGSRPLRRAAVHSGILDAERHGPSVEKWKDL